MPRPATDKRERLTSAASALVRERGIEGATIAEIAHAAGVSPGSVYYYFKTKDDVALAVATAALDARGDAIQTWSDHGTAIARLTAYVTATAARKAEAIEGDTSVGLSMQLRNATPQAVATASEVLRRTTTWATAQYVELGFTEDAAAARALHLVAGIEGAAALAHALGDATVLDREAAHLTRWIANTKA